MHFLYYSNALTFKKEDCMQGDTRSEANSFIGIWQEFFNGKEQSLDPERRIMKRLNRLAVLCSFLSLMLFSYFDSRLGTVSGVNFLEVLAEGRPFDFYAYREAHPLEVGSLYTGGILWLIPRAIWNLPSFIALKLFSYNYAESSLLLFWGRLYLMPYFIWALTECLRIAKILGFDARSRERLVYLSLGSIWIYINLFYAAMPDFIWLAFGIAAYRFFLEGRTKGFVLLAAFSIDSKPMFLPLFVLILISKEKNILKLAGCFLAGMSVTLIDKGLISSACYRYREIMAKSNVYGIAADGLKRFSIPLGDIYIPLLFIVAAVLYLWVYFTPALDPIKDWRRLMGRFLLIIVSFFLLTDIVFYRPVMIFPWLYFLMADNERRLNSNLILEALLGLSGPLLFILKKEPLFDLIAYRNSLLLPPPYAIVQHRHEWSFEFFAFMGEATSPPILLLKLFVLILMIALLYLNVGCGCLSLSASGGASEALASGGETNERGEKKRKICLLFRSLQIPLWLLFSLYIYFA